MTSAPTVSTALITETFGFGSALMHVSVDIRQLEKHPDCTDYQRGLLKAAREALWIAECEILTAKKPEEVSE